MGRKGAEHGEDGHGEASRVGESQGALARINAALGDALRRVQAEGVSPDGTAGLVDLDPCEVRRLVKPVPTMGASPVQTAARPQANASLPAQ